MGEGRLPVAVGSKRPGWLATLVFLDLNGMEIEAPDDDAHELVVGLASGRIGIAEVAEALGTWSR